MNDVQSNYVNFLEKQPKYKTRELLLTFLLIYTSLSWVPDAGVGWIKLAGFMSTALVAIFCIKKNSHVGLKKTIIPYVLLLYIMLFIALILHGRLDELSWMAKLTLAILVLGALRFEVFIDCLLQLSKLLFYPTILGFLCSFYGISYQIPTWLLSGDKSYFITPFLTLHHTSFETRAYSIFWEPGIFACFANIVIAVRLFWNGQRLRQCWIELIFIVLSQSIGGLLSFSILMLAYSARKSRVLDRSLFLFGLAFLIFLSQNFNQIFNEMERSASLITSSLFSRNLAEDESFAARSIDFYLPFSTALKNPFFGFQNINEFVNASTALRGQSAQIITNSWASLAYFYGYVFLGGYALMAYLAITRIGNSRSYLLSFWFFILLTSAPIYTTVFILFFLLSLVQMRRSVHWSVK